MGGGGHPRQPQLGAGRAPMRPGPVAPVRPQRPLPPVDDRTRVIPAVTDENRTTAGLRRPDPEEFRSTDALRRGEPIDGGSGWFRATASGNFHPVPVDAVPPSARMVDTGGFSAFTQDDEDPVTSAGSFRAFQDDTADNDDVGEGGVTGSGAFRAFTGTSSPATEGRSTASGGFPPVREDAEGRATASGRFRPAKKERGTSTGSHRPVREDAGEGRSTSSGSFRATSTGSHRPVGEGRSTGTGSHRVVSDGRSTVTGTHRAMGKVAGRRRIAKWPIAVGVFVVLVVAGLLAWGWASNVLNSRAEAQANACTDGNSTLTVVVTPSIQKPVQASANRWNQANTVVHAHCVHIDVRAIPSQQVLDALTGKTDIATIGGLPAAWVPENEYWVDQLQTTKPGMVGAPAESIATASSADYPFLGLAGNTIDEVQARAAQVFRDFLREPAQAPEFTAVGLTAG